MRVVAHAVEQDLGLDEARARQRDDRHALAQRLGERAEARLAEHAPRHRHQVDRAPARVVDAHEVGQVRRRPVPRDELPLGVCREAAVGQRRQPQPAERDEGDARARGGEPPAGADRRRGPARRAAGEADGRDVRERGRRLAQRGPKEPVARGMARGDPVGDLREWAAPRAVDEVPREVADHPAGHAGRPGDPRRERRDVADDEVDTGRAGERGLLGHHARRVRPIALERGERGGQVVGQAVGLDHADVERHRPDLEVARHVGLEQPARGGRGEDQAHVGPRGAHARGDRRQARGVAVAVRGDGEVERGGVRGGSGGGHGG